MKSLWCLALSLRDNKPSSYRWAYSLIILSQSDSFQPSLAVGYISQGQQSCPLLDLFELQWKLLLITKHSLDVSITSAVE